MISDNIPTGKCTVVLLCVFIKISENKACMEFYVIDPRFERLMKSQVSVTHILKPTYRQNPVELTPQLVDLQTMQNCVKNLKNNKAAGHDGICSEHFKYAGLDLLVHMCLLFNTMLCHSFVPSDFCYGMIVPLLKDKHGDASKIDMYRGITLSCSASKLFESVLPVSYTHLTLPTIYSV